MTTTLHARRGNAARRRSAATTACAVLVAACLTAPAAAQMGFGFGGQAVGGISVDAHGIVRNLEPEASRELAEKRRELLARPERPDGRPAALRKVSLGRLCAAVDACAAKGEPLPPDVLLLGGLERITHVFVDPNGHDIVLAGPADTAAVDASGTVVAAASGRPLLHLEDLVVALRAIDGARSAGVQCSIDPSPEGVAKLQRYLAGLKTMGANPEATLRTMESVLGPQRVTIAGVPAESRIARVLVAADYRMKRIGMGLEPAGIEGLPSYLAMVPAGSTSGAMLPRFWLEADYDPLARDPDELAWEIGARRMKCLTESDLATRDGPARGKAAADKIAGAWCALMTEHYADLARRQPVFAELVNCVDLAVVAALIRGRQLDRRAGLDLAPLTDATRLAVPAYDAPATLSTVATGFKKGSRWIVSASGGVQFQPWAFATNTTESAGSAATRAAALAGRPVEGWRWD
ncbi:MAG: DUF1598 domain-containing protein [Planctomycetia bacterium]|nr:DUF1598 domain-containing protein [Planctomycetia bacterium]